MTHASRSLRIVMGGRMGDCLLHSPFIRHFRRSRLYDRITCVAANETLQLFDHNPHIDLLIGCKASMLSLWALPEEGSDIFAPFIEVESPLNPDGGLRSRGRFKIKCRRDPGWPESDLPIVRQMALHHGIALEDESLEVFTAPEDEAWAENFVREFGDGPLILFNRRTASRWKEYPKDRWQAVADALADQATLLEFAEPAETLAGVKCVSPVLPLRRTAALLRRTHCAITVDSLLAHLAAAAATPAVVVFGPTNPSVWGHPVNRNIRCAPCEPCQNPDEENCTEPLCLTQLPHQLIVEAVLSELAGSGSTRIPRSPAATSIPDLRSS